MISRRKFIEKSSIAMVGACLLPLTGNGAGNDGTIMTVMGPILPSQLKFTLSHEHVLVDFIGADKVSKERYQVEEVYKTALPFLQEIKAKGCNTFIDCTPAYLGRDAQLLQELSKATGLNIITNTGYYGARDGKFLPHHVNTETAEQIAERWIQEWKDGIEGTGIKPGFIKSGVDKAPLSAAQRKIIDAAALTHLATGLTIGVHTGNGEAAEEELEILAKRGVAPSARIWIHAQNESDKSYHIRAAQRGSWISFDGVSVGTLQQNVEYLKAMKEEGLLNSVLVSQDSGWYNVGESNGGDYKNYNFIQTGFIPALRRNGFLQTEIDILFVSNPAKAFALGVRKM